MRILIAGGTGNIGQKIVQLLLKQSDDITILTRYAHRYVNQNTHNLTYSKWEGKEYIEAIKNADAVINLSGQNIFDHSWTESYKKEIYNSRVGVTKQLVNSIKQIDNSIKVFINASAIGYYRSSGSQWLDENDPSGDDFLAQLCQDWEQEALKISSESIRYAILRIGVVLDKDSGTLKKMRPIFKLGMGSWLGSGKQYISWIHIHDLCRLIAYTLKNKDMQGIFNATSPNPVTGKVFAKNLGKSLSRPVYLSVPVPILNMLLGSRSSILMNSMRVSSQSVLNKNFKFYYPDIYDALCT